jgi:hypothetical protein
MVAPWTTTPISLSASTLCLMPETRAGSAGVSPEEPRVGILSPLRGGSHVI